jgi:HEPN domain
MAKKARTQSIAEAKSATSFLKDAFADYLAARVLLNNQLPHQGAMMASTALEKYFKAILATRGQRIHGHLQTAHWNAVGHLHPTLVERLDREFVKLCQKSYSLRYTDDLPNGYNLVIASKEFLAELDVSVALIEKSLRMQQDGKEMSSNWELRNAAGDKRLLENNHVLLGIGKFEFIYRDAQFVFEVRNDARLGVVQFTYETFGPPKTAGFLRPACLVSFAGGGVSFELAFGRKSEAETSMPLDS